MKIRKNKRKKKKCEFLLFKLFLLKKLYIKGAIFSLRNVYISLFLLHCPIYLFIYFFFYFVFVCLFIFFLSFFFKKIPNLGNFFNSFFSCCFNYTKSIILLLLLHNSIYNDSLAKFSNFAMVKKLSWKSR